MVQGGAQHWGLSGRFLSEEAASSVVGVDGAQSLMCMWLVRSGLRDAPAVEQDRTGDHCLDPRGQHPVVSIPAVTPSGQLPAVISCGHHPAVSMQSSDVLRTEEHIQVADLPERNGNAQPHPNLCTESCGGFIHNYQQFKKTRCLDTGRWTNKQRFGRTMEYSARKRSKPLIHAIPWSNPHAQGEVPDCGCLGRGV